MSLAPETKLNEYVIGAPLGAGGMGEVYRARDTKLDREVAIKVLPDGVADDAERLARFEREAKLLASLNHENIATLYGLGESGSVRFLAMELVEGETLAERLGRGPLAIDEASAIFRQIALALEAAHENGVIHRDLKPANIKITEDGKVKVLDFGLAKALVQEPSDEDLSQSPTAAYSGTMAGVIMGTAPYMSPEQARGRKVDQRTDVWAFGCVLYEALTGKKPFEGETVTDTLAAVVRAEPDWNALPESTPSSVRRLLRRALTKDRSGRLPHVGAARLEIEDSGEEPTPVTEVASRSLIPFAVVGLLLALVTGVVVWLVMRPDGPEVVRLALLPAEGALEPDRDHPDLTLSPDGTRVVFATREQLFVRRLNELVERPLTNLGESPAAPAVSPDGFQIAYFADGMLKRVPIDGGPPITICPVVGEPRGVSWGADDTIVFASRSLAGLNRVSALGGEPEAITVVDKEGGELSHRWPEFLPDGRSVVFEIDRSGNIEASSIGIVSVDAGEKRELLTGGSYPRYAPSGHLVYAGENGLWAVGFDIRRLELMGAPVPIMEDVVTKGSNAANFAIGRDGTLIYMRGGGQNVKRTFVWVDRDGNEEPIGLEGRTFMNLALSPDGSRIVTEVRESNVDVWTHDLARETSTRLTFDPEPDTFPIWSSDGEHIVYRRGNELVQKAADGTGEVELLLAESVLPSVVLPGDRGIIARRGADTDWDLVLVTSDGVSPILDQSFDQSSPTLSPDGRWLAYQSNESGRNEVYVRPFPDVDAGRWQVSVAGGSRPLWAPNGRELFYRTEDDLFMSVAIETDPFAPGRAEVLFEDRYFRSIARQDFGISPDGEKFLMIRDVSYDAALGELVVVLNWHEELKRLVPTE